jgi:hypothetical protein
MVGFGVRVSRGADILKIALGQGWLVLGERCRSARRRGSPASPQQKGANGYAEKRKIIPVTQRRRY